MASPRHARARAARSWPQRIFLTFGALLTLSCVAAASAVGYVYWKTGQFQRFFDLPLDERASPEDPTNYLIIGSDSRENIDPNDPNAGLILDKSIGGKRSDTIMVVRIDPVAGTVQMLSFPRDLFINIAGQDSRDRINSAYGYGRDVLVETIRQDFGIQIHNYIEVDLEGFQKLVNEVGGVSMWVDWPMRDTHSGLQIDQTGCVTLDGTQALAFARSRYFEYKENGKWRGDGSSDLGRITRQQFFIRKALKKAAGMNLATDPLAFNSLLDVATNSVGIDESIDRGDLLALVRRFEELKPEEIESYSLTAKGHTTSGGASVLLLDDDDPQNRRTLNVFRGLPPDAVGEGDVTVEVRNGTGVDGQAKDVSAALGAVGFDTGDTGDAKTSATTTIRYAPGSEAAADLLGRHLTGPALLDEDDSLGTDHVVLVTGADFTTVMQQPRPATTTTTTTTSTVPTTTPADGSSTSAPATTTTTTVGVTPGEAPPGQEC